MYSSHGLLRTSLVGLAIIFSGTAGAASLTCTATRTGYRCEAWPQGADYRYEWHTAHDTAGTPPDTAMRRIRCPANHATAIAVSIIAPAGYVETATRLLPACADIEQTADATIAASF
jgi:hypothetical protein